MKLLKDNGYQSGNFLVVNWLQCGLYRLEILNEKRDGMVQRVKVAEKEKDSLEVSQMLQTCKIFVEEGMIFELSRA
jgi:hypothetical protein